MTINPQIQVLVSNRRKQFIKITECQTAAEELYSQANELEIKAFRLDGRYIMDTDIEKRKRIVADIEQLFKEAKQYRAEANKLSTEAYNLSNEVYMAVKNAAIALYGANVSVSCHGAAAMTINGIRYTGEL